MRVVPVTRKLAEFKKVYSLFEHAFPYVEKLPMWLLLLLSKRNDTDFLAFYDKEQFCGIAYLISGNGQTFVFYLATDEALRSKGYGSQILSLIKDKYAPNNIVLNIETVKPSANYEQRVKRQAFYFKNGFVDTGYKFISKSEPYDVLFFGKEFNKGEYENLINNFSYGFVKLNVQKGDS